MTRPRAVMHPVRVVVTKDGNAYGFHADSDIWNDSAQQLLFHKDRHGMRKQDFHLVEFLLEDRTGERLKFPAIPHDAMWVVKVEPGAEVPCPTKDSTSDYSVMDPICVCDDGKRLIVRNDNPRKEDWSFTLNLVRSGDDQSDSNRYVSWDPIGSNQNGGTGGR